MAKSRSKSRTRRGVLDAANDPVSLLASHSPLRSGRLTEVEDRRLFYPGVRPVRMLRNRVASLLIRPTQKARSKPGFSGREVLAFRVPESTLVCMRRAARKEVLHAKKKVGRGVRRPRRNALSSISCKR